jgi:hypothetical protein
LSSIEPNDSGGEVDGGEEVPGSLVVAGSDGTELLELAVEVFDEMASFVHFLVERSRCFAVAFLGNDNCLTGGQQRLDEALVGIERLVSQQDFGLHVRQQGIAALQIVGLARGQEEAKRIAQRVDRGVDFGAQSAFAAPDRLILAVFFWAPALC